MVSKYEHFSLSISRIYHDIQKIERTQMEGMGLKGPHAQILLTLHRYPEGVTAVQLCELCAKDKAAVSRTIAELEEKGMVMRRQFHGSSYRALLQLTPEGEKAAREVGERAVMAVEQAGKGLDDENREVFYQVLALIAENLHTLCTEGIHHTGD